MGWPTEVPLSVFDWDALFGYPKGGSKSLRAEGTV